MPRSESRCYRFSSAVLSRWNRLRGTESAIRLTDDGQETLPFFIDGQKAAEEGYTSAHLLFECTVASLWNTACYLYLFYPPRFGPDGQRIAPSSTYTNALLALIAIPLLIGTAAGAAALFGDSELDRETREKAGWAKKAAWWFGLIGCIAGVWPILFYVIRGQDAWLQRHLAVTTAIVQALIVRAGSETFSDDEDEDEDEQICLAIEEEAGFEDEKALLTVREFLLESSTAAQAPLLIPVDEEKRELVEVKVEQMEQVEERVLIHSFSA
ncbi:hypothetical protein JCM10207_009272 [Rhodosporidiobolus poonsookiae]